MRLESRGVVLRAFRASELDAFVRSRMNDEGAATGIRGPRRAELRRRLQKSGRWDRGWITLAIEARGRLVGDVQARGYPREAMPPGVLDIGLTIWSPDDRGRGYGTTALTILARWLLGPGGAGRVQGSTASTNKAMQRSFAKAGFRREGVMRAFMPAERGGRDDYVLYSKTSGVSRPAPSRRGASVRTA